MRRIRNFFQGWGVGGPTAGKQSGQRFFFFFFLFFFFFFFFYSPELILKLTEGVQWF